MIDEYYHLQSCAHSFYIDNFKTTIQLKTYLFLHFQLHLFRSIFKFGFGEAVNVDRRLFFAFSFAFRGGTFLRRCFSRRFATRGCDRYRLAARVKIGITCFDDSDISGGRLRRTLRGTLRGALRGTLRRTFRSIAAWGVGFRFGFDFL